MNKKKYEEYYSSMQLAEFCNIAITYCLVFMHLVCTSRYCALHDSHRYDKEPLYWTPADDCSGIYQQFSSKGFREITADQIQYRNCNNIIIVHGRFICVVYRTTAELGSGQFRCVHKGVWHSPEWTCKCSHQNAKNRVYLKKQMVKFLQEAAIMGQFQHPNIVELHGVVAVGEPVSL